MLKLHMIALCMFLFAAGAAGAKEQLFPQVPGWTMSQESRVYDANDLWDIIDGAADLYLEYAFVDLHIARYKTSAGREVKVEVYRHRDMENAFGIYSAERSPENNFLAIGSQGYQQTSILNFTAGEFYLRLSSYQSDSASRTDLLTIARGIEGHVKRGAALPQALRLFPAKGKVANSEQLIAQNFLGYGFLRSVYTASYGGSAPCKAFIIEKKSKSDADSTLAEYFSKVPRESITSAGDWFDVQDPNSGPVSIALQGSTIYGCVSCMDERAKDELLAELKHYLTQSDRTGSAP